jgi:microcystin-dependent protein
MTIDNHQPTMALNEYFVLEGYFPNPPSDPGAVMPLATVRTLAWTHNEMPTASGQQLPIAQNTALFALIGTLYGGNGQTTFALPDLRGRVALGDGPSVSTGEVSGSETLYLTGAQLPPSSGGTSLLTSDAQPSLVITYYIRIQGDVPLTGSDASPDLPFLGSVTTFAGYFVPGSSADSPPYAECDGRLLAIADYANLYAVLGTAYGGDGVTNFALPDFRERAPVGASASHPRGQAFGADSSQITLANMPVNMGGNGDPISNYQPSQALTYLIAVEGMYLPDSVALPDSEAMAGEIVAFAGDYAPAGYRICDGSLLAVADFPTLFAALGTRYGGDGTTTFALPDLRGRSVAGTGQGPASQTTPWVMSSGARASS